VGKLTNIVALALVLAGCSAKELFSPERKLLFHTRKEISDTLLVNTRATVGYSVKKPFLDGLLSLERLSTNSEKEESWVYDFTNSTWEETGYGESDWETSDSADTQLEMPSASIGVYTDYYRTQEVARRNSQVPLIHMHPMKNSPVYEFAMRQDDEESRLKYLRRHYFLSTIPSINDLDCLWKLPKLGIDAKFYVASPVGVTEYYLTDIGKIAVDGLIADDGRIENFYLSNLGVSFNIIESKKMMIEVTRSLMPPSHEPLKDAIMQAKILSEQLSNSYIQVKFYSYDELRQSKEKGIDLFF